jgi:hypothetical protein
MNTYSDNNWNTTYDNPYIEHFLRQTLAYYKLANTLQWQSLEYLVTVSRTLTVIAIRIPTSTHSL